MRCSHLLAALVTGAVLLPATTAGTAAASPPTPGRVGAALDRGDAAARSLRAAIRAGATARVRVTLRATTTAGAQAGREARRLAAALPADDAAAAQVVAQVLLVVEHQGQDAALFAGLLDRAPAALTRLLVDATASALAARDALLALVPRLQQRVAVALRPVVADATVRLNVQLAALARRLAATLPDVRVDVAVAARVRELLTGLPALLERQVDVGAKLLVDLSADVAARLAYDLELVRAAVPQLQTQVRTLVDTGADVLGQVAAGLQLVLDGVVAQLTPAPAPATPPAGAAPPARAGVDLLARLLVRLR